eukprot:CAMPEP_0172312068 /NCGR_PEP_ID=MMETSP1058-20130122/16558_1 /TAXON_ID=83371 /ORGANISM="Detonula confervacea, Strain CCMP 353" /LENGTH=455 /DNA_ID=CAMNT_0013025417 /DNA_START=355 /DNA_END=1722 /DNA_ORIENTATION=+
MKFCTPLVVAILSAGANAQVENPCTICPDGASLGDKTTCNDLIESVKVYEAGSADCDLFQGSEGYESICCPTPAENPCTLCPDGATAGEDYAPFGGAEDTTTCKEMIDSVKVYETGSEYCEAYQGYESFCCPTPLENSCTICPDGATAGEDYAPGADSEDPTTCKEIIESVKAFETGTEFCELSEGYESICCPTPAENPCTICPNGATAGDDYAPFADEEDPMTITCKDLIDLTKTFEADSDYCKEYKILEVYCCPTLAENPCICPDGVTAGDDVIIPDSDNTTCKDIMDLVKFVDAESDLCDDTMKEGGMVCCPPITTEESTSTVAATTAALKESTSTVVASTAAPESSDAATTVVPEITVAANTVTPVEPEEVLSTVSIDESTSTTTASTASASTAQSAPTTQSTSTSGSATPTAPAPDDVTEYDSGVSIFGSGFSGFAFVSIVSALYAIVSM